MRDVRCSHARDVPASHGSARCCGRAERYRAERSDAKHAASKRYRAERSDAKHAASKRYRAERSDAKHAASKRYRAERSALQFRESHPQIYPITPVRLRGYP